jgi:hypothetical protein
MIQNSDFLNWLFQHGNPDKDMMENMMDYEIHCERKEYEMIKKIALNQEQKEPIKKYYFMPNIKKND